jgi:hypothetical protein
MGKFSTGDAYVTTVDGRNGSTVVQHSGVRYLAICAGAWVSPDSLTGQLGKMPKLNQRETGDQQ